MTVPISLVHEFLARMLPTYPKGYTVRQRVMLIEDVTFKEMKIFAPDLVRRDEG